MPIWVLTGWCIFLDRGNPFSNLYLQPALPRPLLRNQGTLFVPLDSDEYVGDAGLSNPGPGCNFGEGLPEGILGKEWGTVLPGIPGRVLTNQEVKDGHVDDAEKPVAAVIWVDLLYRVTVEGVELPPEGEKKSWGWKSQDARVLGPLSILSLYSEKMQVSGLDPGRELPRGRMLSHCIPGMPSGHPGKPTRWLRWSSGLENSFLQSTGC